MSARARVAAAIAGPAVVVVVLLGAPVTPAAASALSYTCNPPNALTPRTGANCSLWHTIPVSLRWDWDQSAYAPAPSSEAPGSDCTTPHPITTDTAGVDIKCVIQAIDPPWSSVGEIATVRVDMTPPTVTGITPSRPPDSNGWWNHPVSLQFGAKDATSGIAACDTVNYSGPDTETAQVTGACRDQAGNSATGAFGIKYDATPPTLTPVSSEGRNAHATLNWDTSPDAVGTRVLRSPGIGGAPVTEVYSGSDKTYTDSAVQDDATYTYTIIASDAAANAASTVMVVTPKADPKPKPAARLRAPLLRWRMVKGADYYNVQVYRGRRKILSAWPRGTKLRMRQQWSFRGRRRVLTAGRYHWYVWPGFGRRSQHRYGRLITHRRFTIKLRPS